jgi:catechol 2,3-dioxygenase-like lactoylglutathione lyase family enzyme
MDDAQIVALLSGIEPSEGEIPKPPFMAAIPAGPVLDAGVDVAAVDAWVKARGGWTHRTPAHLADANGKRAPLFFIVPKGHLQGVRPGPRFAAGRGAPPATGGGVASGVAGPAAVGGGGAGGGPGGGGAGSGPGGGGAGPSTAGGGAATGGGLASAEIMAFVATSDLAAARAFYGRGLGLRMTGQSPIACTFDAAGTTLRVVAAEKPVIAPYTVLGWTVSDIRATVGDLAGRGIDFERFEGIEQDELGVWSAPGGALVAWFKDPDGNTLALTQF